MSNELVVIGSKVTIDLEDAYPALCELAAAICVVVGAFVALGFAVAYVIAKVDDIEEEDE